MRLPTKKNWGRAAENENPAILRQLDEIYTDIANAVNVKPKSFVTSGQSATNSAEINRNFDTGDFWIRTDTNQIWVLTSRSSPTVVNWKLL